MIKLYDLDPYTQHFTAEVVSITEKDNQFHIVLDQTAFYPEGGGQPSDIGMIEDCMITHVYEESDIIYHVSPKKPIKIHKLKCHIDWTRRLDHMQHHMAQHILSACLLDTCGASTLSFHLGSEKCTLDIDKILTNSELLLAEKAANDVIAERIATEILYPTKQQLKKLKLPHALPKVNGPVRIVKIGDLDNNPCCGTHPCNTSEVQLIKILKHEKYKGGLRLTFIAGQRALTDALSQYHFVTEVCGLLKTNPQDALIKLQGLTQTITDLTNDNRRLKNVVADYEVKTMLEEAPLVGTLKLVRQRVDGMSIKDAQLLGTKLTATPDVLVLFGLAHEGNAHLLFMCSKDLKQLNMNLLLKDCMTLIDGRGGGSAFSAQGGGKSLSNLDMALDYAAMKIKNTL
ncbi:MAG: alanyl-tRNA editing protein [Cellulosilyticaceae bacterium]